METLPVQSVGVGAAALSISAILNGTSAGDDSFASTLGRALENLPAPAQNGLSVPFKAFGRPTTEDNAGLASKAGTPTDYLIAGLVQPSPVVAPSTEVPASTANLQGSTAEKASDSTLTSESDSSTSVGEADPKTGTSHTSAAAEGVAGVNQLPAWAGKGIASPPTAKAGAPRPALRGGGDIAAESTSLPSMTNQTQVAASSQPVSASGWLPGFQDNSILNKLGEQQSSEVSPNSEQLLASNPQASPYFSLLSAWSRDMNATQTATTPQANSIQGLQAPSSPTPLWDPSGQNSSASGLPAQGGLEPSNPSTQAGNDDTPEREEVANLLAKFAGAEVTLKYQSPGLTMVDPSTAVDTGMGGLHAASVSPLPNAVTAKSENTMVTPAKGVFHPAQGSNGPANDVTGQKANGAEAAGLHDFSSTATVLSQPPDASSPPATPAASQRKDATAADNGLQPPTLALASTGESAAHANLSDSSTNGQEREQTGPSAGDNPTDVKFIGSSVPADTAPDSATNLLTVQASQVPVSHADNSMAPTAVSPSQPPTTLSAWQNYEAGALVRSAWLSDSARGAEMRVELRSGALGLLEVRASVHDGSVGAEIHVEDHETHALLAAGLPSLERAMGERNLRVENIAVYQDRAGGEMTGGENQNPHSGSSASPQPQVLPGSNTPQPSSAGQNSSDVEELASTAGGLSVRV